MKQSFPDTVAMWESTRADGLSHEEIFTPDVKVLLSWRDVEAAVDAGAVVPTEAYALWAYWAAPGSPGRLAAQAMLRCQELANLAAEEEAALLAAPVPEPVQSAQEPVSHLLGGKPTPQAVHKVAAHPVARAGVPMWLRIVLGGCVPALVVWLAGQRLGYW